MQLRLREAWKGVKLQVARCPHCGSQRVRNSRRTYDGLWSTVFKVRPIRCLSCGIYFPVSARAVRPADVDLVDLHLPFRPAELEETEEAEAERPGQPRVATPVVSATYGACPSCGSKAVRPARSSGPPNMFRLNAKEPYRCIDCNASFDRMSFRRVAVGVLILVGMLGGLALILNTFLPGSLGRGNSPRIRENQVPKLPPPVFR